MPLRVYNKVEGTQSTFKKVSAAYYLGEARQNERRVRCGEYDPKKFKCIVAQEENHLKGCDEGKSRILSLSQEEYLKFD